MGKSLDFFSIPLNYIIPYREWTSSKIISIHPRIHLYIIQWTIDNHIFLSFWVLRHTNHLIGMICSSGGFVVTPVGINFWKHMRRHYELYHQNHFSNHLFAEFDLVKSSDILYAHGSTLYSIPLKPHTHNTKK